MPSGSFEVSRMSKRRTDALGVRGFHLGIGIDAEFVGTQTVVVN
jgi:hypothetical protein